MNKVVTLFFLIALISCSGGDQTNLSNEKTPYGKGGYSYLHSNGALKAWCWFDDDTSTLPIYMIELDTNENVVKQSGRSILGAYTFDDSLGTGVEIELVNPPVFQQYFEYRDYLGDSLVKVSVFYTWENRQYFLGNC